MVTADPRRAVVAGAGNMGTKWLATAQATPGIEVVGIVDLDLDQARDAGAAAGVGAVVVGSSLPEVITATGANVLIDAAVPSAHYELTVAAMQHGCDVLGEKPAAEDVAQALTLCAASEAYGTLFMVSQSRRYNDDVEAIVAARGALGQLGILQTDFYRGPRFGGFREEMAYPLLVDMAIHPFDTARYLLAAEPVSVYCHSFNPPWSWYRGDAGAMAIFEMSNGTQYAYNASWCSDGAETSWNGSWRLNGAAGTILWDGDSRPRLAVREGAEPVPQTAGRPVRPGIAGALDSFLDGLRRRYAPRGAVQENVLSLVMVQAAVESARSGRSTAVADVLEQAHRDALSTAADPVVREQLDRWTSVTDHLLAASGRRVS